MLGEKWSIWVPRIGLTLEGKVRLSRGLVFLERLKILPMSPEKIHENQSKGLGEMSGP